MPSLERLISRLIREVHLAVMDLVDFFYAEPGTSLSMYVSIN